MSFQRSFKQGLVAYMLITCVPVFGVVDEDQILGFEGTEELSHGPPTQVIRLLYPTGRDKVVRLTNSNDSLLEYEKFVSEFLNKKAGIRTPKIEILPAETVRKIGHKISSPDFSFSKIRGMALGWTAGSISDFVPNAIEGGSYLETNGLFDQNNHVLPSRKSLAAIPEALRQRLFDIWAVLIVLGVHDFHSRNWLLAESEKHGFEVIPIDLSDRSYSFYEGSGDAFPIGFAQHHPFSVLQSHDLSTAFIQENISEQTRQLIAGFSSIDILWTAKKSGYPITLKQLFGIKRRAKMIANKASLRCDDMLYE